MQQKNDIAGKFFTPPPPHDSFEWFDTKFQKKKRENAVEFRQLKVEFLK